MHQSDVVKAVADRIPANLRELRGKATLSEMCRVMGIEEVECPACGGTGWLDPRYFRHCPVCRGFREVPTALAGWVREQLREMKNGSSNPPRGAMNTRDSGRAVSRLGRVVTIAYKVEADALQALQN